MNVQAATVVPLRQVNAVVVPSKPKVFTPELVGALSALNRLSRWLRERDVVPLSVDLGKPRPTIVVPASAAQLLTVAAHGKSVQRLDGGESLCSVVLHECTVQWRLLQAK
jgi:hypothetical protein